MTEDSVSVRSHKESHGTASRFLSKASQSLRRSPSKKRASRPASPLPADEGLIRESHILKTHANRPSGVPSKQDLDRTTSAPVAVQTLKHTVNASSKEEKLPHSTVEAAMIVAPLLSHAPKDPITASTQNAASLPSRNDSISAANNAPSQIGQPTPGLTSSAPGPQHPHAIYQNIHEMASKRIATLDYMRRA